MTARSEAYDESLAKAHEHVRRWLASLDERPIGPRVTATELLEGLGGPLPDARHRPRGRRRPARAGGRAGADGDRVRPVLRLGDRRHAAGRARRRLAGQRLGPERRHALRRRRPTAALEEVGRRPGCSTCWGCRPTADVGFVTGAHDGQLHRPGRRPPAVLDRGRLGRRPRRADRRAAGARPGRAPSGTTRSTSRCATSGSARPTAGRRRRPGPDPRSTRWPRRWPRCRRTARRSSCLQAGNLHSGAFDPFAEAIELAHARGAWVHVDGAFGLWAAAVAARCGHLADGLARRRLVGHRRAQDAQRAVRLRDRDRRATRPRCGRRSGVHASYLISRRDRTRRPVREGAGAVAAGPRGAGVGGAAVARPVAGVADAGRRAGRQRAARSPTGIARDPGGRGPQRRRLHAGLRRVRRRRAHPRGDRARCSPTAPTWMSGSRWHDRDVLRVSVSNWSTDDARRRRSVEAVRAAAAG